MKHNSITSITGQEQEPLKISTMPAGYERIVIAYQEWLGLLGYSQSTVKSLPRQVQAFFKYLADVRVQHLQQVEQGHIRAFYSVQKQRASLNTGQLLAGSTLNGYLRNLRLLSKYLQETAQGFLEVDIPNEPKTTPEKEILSQQEIKLLYNSIDESMTGLRDRTLLNIYYGCGLRSNEGVQLNVNDILLDKRLVYVRKGKGYKERYVPFVESQYTDFKNYLDYCRPHLLKHGANNAKQESFLINNQGRRINYNTALKALKSLQSRAEDETLKNKQIGLHTLRHSIATHLMQSGMPIENISTFLGHKHLSSTQIYTHIVHTL